MESKDAAGRLLIRQNSIAGLNVFTTTRSVYIVLKTEIVETIARN